MLGNTLVGRYQIISNLGGGGFGETFVAYDTHLPGSPQCVVKKLKPQANDPTTYKLQDGYLIQKLKFCISWGYTSVFLNF